MVGMRIVVGVDSIPILGWSKTLQYRLIESGKADASKDLSKSCLS